MWWKISAGDISLIFKLRLFFSSPNVERCHTAPCTLFNHPLTISKCRVRTNRHFIPISAGYTVDMKQIINGKNNSTRKKAAAAEDLRKRKAIIFFHIGRLDIFFSFFSRWRCTNAAHCYKCEQLDRMGLWMGWKMHLNGRLRIIKLFAVVSFSAAS